MEELVKKWEKTGLLNELVSSYDKEQVARALEQATSILLERDPITAQFVAPYVFPVIRITVPTLLEAAKVIDFEHYVNVCISKIVGERAKAKLGNAEGEKAFCQHVSNLMLEEFRGE